MFWLEDVDFGEGEGDVDEAAGRTRRFLPAKAVATALAAAGGLLSLLAPSPATASETGYNPNDLPVASCFWTGPFTRDDPKTNVAFPGTEITYWGAKFVTPPGAELTLKGRFPHARYSSLNAYIENGESSGSLRDSAIEPDPGSINPSIPGRNRAAKNRSYTVTVLGEAEPAEPAPNTLYAEPVSGSYQDILYRVYIPDKGRDLAGGTGLPQPSLRLQDGTVLTGQPLCDAINSIHDYTNQFLPLNVYNLFLQGKGPENAATNPAERKPAFSRYYNLPNSYARYGTVNDQEIAWENNPDYEGTQYDNADARYMTGAFAFDFGDVFVLRGTLPTTPRTLNGEKKMTSGQLVAWDMCIIQSLVTTKTWRCVFDEQLPLRTRGKKKRQYTIVISKREDRPKNATFRCGAWWMPPDPEGDGAGRPNVGQLLTRNVLPAANFRQSSWAVPSPFPADAISAMGQYYPRGSYTSKQAFERLGCATKKKRR